ncbi:MAG: LysM peptidoglycan-binding domain-containing protein [Flavobacteriales bacterium]|nr:LysM peptidoglycan-binding domain-containing protein [Flavobacteriales bacterium]
MKYVVFTAVLCVMGFFSFSAEQPTDSVTTKVRNGKVFIVHKVEKGQGLYSISRKYNVTVEQILDANPGSTEQIQLDQLLYIPTGKKAPLEQPVVKDYFENTDRNKEEKSVEPKGKATFARYHEVKKGETLFSISQIYNTKVDVIKSLNNLSDNELSVGQKLMVPSTSETTANTGSQPVTDRPGKAQEAEETVDQLREVAHSTPYTGYETRTEFIKEFDVQKVWERGMAEVGTYISKKGGKTCSHHAAEIGSTIMVTNPETNEAVFVKVVSRHKLDEKKANIVVLSTEAAEKIGIEGSAVVEISFAH